MLKRMPRTMTAEQSLKSGLFKLRDIAACAYGNGKWIQYRDAAGTCKLTMSMGEIVKNASVEDVEASKALAVLSATALPENGVKTMVILLAALLEKAEQLGCTEADVNAVYALLEYAANYLPNNAEIRQEPGAGSTFREPVSTSIRKIRGPDCTSAQAASPSPTFRKKSRSMPLTAVPCTASRRAFLPPSGAEHSHADRENTLRSVPCPRG